MNMRGRFLVCVSFAGVFAFSAGAYAVESKAFTSKTLQKTIRLLQPLHAHKHKARPGEWLFVHAAQEKGQIFRQYIRSRPIRPTTRRGVIYLQRLGTFTAGQQKILNLTADYMRLYFGLPVRFAEDLSLSILPASAQRVHPEWKVKQILSTHVLYKVLKPRLPKDAVAYMCFTPVDLWPGKNWNFVFGQAAIRDRVGVQSLFRNGDADGSAADFQLCLRRTLRTATHETGHMFSMLHCIQYECNMNGSNSRIESDEQVLWLCPECMAKVCWAMQRDPLERYRALYSFLAKNGFAKEAAFLVKTIRALGGAVEDLPVVAETNSLEQDRVQSVPVAVEPKPCGEKKE